MLNGTQLATKAAEEKEPDPKLASEAPELPVKHPWKENLIMATPTVQSKENLIVVTSTV